MLSDGGDRDWQAKENESKSMQISVYEVLIIILDWTISDLFCKNVNEAFLHLIIVDSITVFYIR